MPYKFGRSPLASFRGRMFLQHAAVRVPKVEVKSHAKGMIGPCARFGIEHFLKGPGGRIRNDRTDSNERA